LKRGYPPYRLNVRSMGDLEAGADYTSLMRSLKSAFDPRGILAPGRYEPSEVSKCESSEVSKGEVVTHPAGLAR